MILHPRDSQLSRFVDRSLAAPQRSTIARHLASCASCRGTVQAYRDIGREAQGVGAPQPAPELWTLVLERYDAGASVILPVADPPVVSRRSVRARLLAAAASVLGLIVASSIGCPWGEGGSWEAVPLRPPPSLAVSQAGAEHVRLGSLVTSTEGPPEDWVGPDGDFGPDKPHAERTGDARVVSLPIHADR